MKISFYLKHVSSKLVKVLKDRICFQFVDLTLKREIIFIFQSWLEEPKETE